MANRTLILKWTKQAEILEKKSIFLKKGDVLFWHPSLLHGSVFKKSLVFKKILTAHYHPSEMLRGGGGKHIIDMEYEKNLLSKNNL